MTLRSSQELQQHPVLFMLVRGTAKLQAGGDWAGETLEGSNDLENYFPQKCRTHQSAAKCAWSLLQPCRDSPLERSCCRADCWKVVLAERSISSCFFWNRDRKSKDIVFNPNPFIPEQGP